MLLFSRSLLILWWQWAMVPKHLSVHSPYPTVPDGSLFTGLPCPVPLGSNPFPFHWWCPLFPSPRPLLPHTSHLCLVKERQRQRRKGFFRVILLSFFGSPFPLCQRGLWEKMAEPGLKVRGRNSLRLDSNWRNVDQCWLLEQNQIRMLGSCWID